MVQINAKNISTTFFDPAGMKEEEIIEAVKDIDKALKENGCLFIWMNETELRRGLLRWTKESSFDYKDTITWNDRKYGTKYLIVFQKPPANPKFRLSDHLILGIWEENVSGPDEKPLKLQKKLIDGIAKDEDKILYANSGKFTICEKI